MSEEEDPKDPAGEAGESPQEPGADDAAGPATDPAPEPESPVGEPAAAAEPEVGEAHCSTHQHVPAVGTCEHCGSFSCADCLGDLGGRMICRTCVVEGRVKIGLTPWDERAKLGLPAAAWQTVKEVSLTPGAFFANLSPTHFLGAAIGFAVLVGSIGGIANVFTQQLGNVLLFEAFGLDPNALGGDSPFGSAFSTGGVGAILIGIVSAPLGVLIGAMVLGLTSHLGLMMIGGATQKLEATLKVVFYAYAINFWLIVPIPYVNAIVVGLWVYVVTAIGLMHVHQTSGLKATFAVLWFMCTCLCLVGVLAGALGVMAGAALGQ